LPQASPAQTNGPLAANNLVVFGPCDVTGANFIQAQLGGSGDPDLYLRFDAHPTASAFDCRSWMDGANDVCRRDVPSGRTSAYVMVHATQASNYFLKVDVGGTAPTPPPPAQPTVQAQREQIVSSVAPGEWEAQAPYQVAGGSTLRVTIAGSGDADLYVRFGASPTFTAFDCRPFVHGSAEECLLTVPSNGAAAHVSVYGELPSQYWLNITYTPAQ
jgi:serine protease